MRLYVNIYSVGQAYGGPEEGGWWFQVGTVIGCIPVELTHEEWDKVRGRFVYLYGEDDTQWDMDKWRSYLKIQMEERAIEARDYWQERYPSTKNQYSVLGGEDYSVRIEEEMGKDFPEYRPRYE